MEDLLTETEAAKKLSGQRVARDPRVAKRKERRREKLAAREQSGAGGDGGGDGGDEQRGVPNRSAASYSGRGGARGGGRGGARGGGRGGARGGGRGGARGGGRGGARGGGGGFESDARRDASRGAPSPKKPFRYFHLQQASDNSRFEHNSSSSREFSNNSFRCAGIFAYFLSDFRYSSNLLINPQCLDTFYEKIIFFICCSGRQQNGDSGGGERGGRRRVNYRREYKNMKYSYGGQRRGAKRNTRESTDDVSADHRRFRPNQRPGAQQNKLHRRKVLAYESCTLCTCMYNTLLIKYSYMYCICIMLKVSCH